MGRFQDEMSGCALVTGATRGLGLEVARHLAESGTRVVVTGRTEKASVATAASLGPGHIGVRLDVRASADVSALYDLLLARTLRVDILIHNAGVLLNSSDDDAVRQTLETNFYAPVHITEAIGPILAPRCRVILVSSGMGALHGFSAALRNQIRRARSTREVISLADEYLRGLGRFGNTRPPLCVRAHEEAWPDAYSLSKALLNSLAAAWALEYPIRITVAVSPGWIRTRMGGAGAPRSVCEGAQRIMAAATGPVRSGAFYDDSATIE